VSKSKCHTVTVSAFISQQEETEGRPGAAYYVRHAINGLALAAQVTGFILWPVLLFSNTPRIWVLPIALLLISCGWWENFITATKIKGKRDKITIQLPYCLPPATFLSGTTGTYQENLKYSFIY
jgi:hypothetical protein